jgi:outer membrane lipoprotein-sorting protein
LVKVQETFYALKTFHADLAMTSASISMDFVRPDRVRETLSNGMVAVFIGSNAWMSVRGRTMPMPAGMAAPLQARLQSIRTLGLQGKLTNDYTVTYTGTKSVGGVQARTYHLVQKTGSAVVDMRINSKDLPIQARVKTTNGGLVTLRYSKFNAPIVINAP